MQEDEEVESIEFDNLQYDIPNSEMLGIFTELKHFLDSQALLHVLEQIMDHYYSKYRDEIDSYNAFSAFQKEVTFHLPILSSSSSTTTTSASSRTSWTTWQTTPAPSSTPTSATSRTSSEIKYPPPL